MTSGGDAGCVQTKHYHQTHDPLIQSFEPREDWGWCYVDELFLEPAPLQKARR
jgi:hypothetical protein